MLQMSQRKYHLWKMQVLILTILLQQIYQVYNSVTPNGFSKKLDNDGTILDLNTQFMGQIFPRDAQGELTKTDPATLEFVLDFTYTYQKIIIVNRRPRKVDCEEKYHFVGYLNK